MSRGTNALFAELSWGLMGGRIDWHGWAGLPPQACAGVRDGISPCAPSGLQLPALREGSLSPGGSHTPYSRAQQRGKQLPCLFPSNLPTCGSKSQAEGHVTGRAEGPEMRFRVVGTTRGRVLFGLFSSLTWRCGEREVLACFLLDVGVGARFLAILPLTRAPA